MEEFGEEYKSDYFTQVGRELKNQSFSYYQKVRGDGNCYYRAVGFGFFLKLAMQRRAKTLRAIALS